MFGKGSSFYESTLQTLLGIEGSQNFTRAEERNLTKQFSSPRYISRFWKLQMKVGPMLTLAFITDKELSKIDQFPRSSSSKLKSYTEKIQQEELDSRVHGFYIFTETKLRFTIFDLLLVSIKKYSTT